MNEVPASWTWDSFFGIIDIFWQTLQDDENESFVLATDEGKLVVRNLFSCLFFARELKERVSI